MPQSTHYVGLMTPVVGTKACRIGLWVEGWFEIFRLRLQLNVQLSSVFTTQEYGGKEVLLHPFIT